MLGENVGGLRVKLISRGWIANGNLWPAECNEFKMAYLEHTSLFICLFTFCSSSFWVNSTICRHWAALWWAGSRKMWAQEHFLFFSGSVSFSPLHFSCNWTLASGSLKGDLQLLWRGLQGLWGQDAGGREAKWLSRLNSFAPWRARAGLTGPVVLPNNWSILILVTRFPHKVKRIKFVGGTNHCTRRPARHI